MRKAFRLPAAVLGLVFLASLPLAADDTALRDWAAPLFWQPTASPPPEKTSGRETLALPSSPLPFVAITPCRIADTRDGTYPAGYGPPSLQGGGAARTFVIPSGPCAGIPTTAGAYSLNFTVVAPLGTPTGGYLSAWPTGSLQPVVSTLNFTSGSILANAAIVSAGTGGGINLFANFSTDVIIDINGYYAGTGVVTTVNALSGDVTLAAGTNVTITPSGQTLTIAATPGSGGPPTGTAGGSLTGTYPNPGIATGAVGSSQLANSTVVRSINGSAQDMVTIQGSGTVSVGTAGGTITIGAPTGSMVLGAPGDTTLIGAGYTEAAPTSIYFWMPTATSNSPSARAEHTAVWTGTKMIVWGGFDYSVGLFNDGGQYDPVANSWTTTTTTNAPSARWAHTAVWTGTKMIVWGGESFDGGLNDGAQYDPVGDSWTATATSGAPVGRDYHSAVWTGTKMVVWGGNSNEGVLDTGGRYDPAGDSWMGMSTTGAPSARSLHTAVWTGSKMIVWGGWNGSTHFGDGGQYDPAGDSWTATTTAAAPSARRSHTAVWAGTKMIVWGGYVGTTYVSDGGQYEPNGNSWTPTSTVGAPVARYMHTAVWNGSKMIVWGGIGTASPYYLSDGSQYEPATNSWGAMATAGAPAGRSNHTAVWTGSRMIVWGGGGSGIFFNSGGQWAPVSLYVKN